MTWRWVLGLVAMDVVMLSVAVVIGGGFNHFFFHLLYYAVRWPGTRWSSPLSALTMAWVTVVAAVYLAVSLTVGKGVDIEGGFEKALLARIFVMYAVAAAV